MAFKFIYQTVSNNVEYHVESNWKYLYYFVMFNLKLNGTWEIYIIETKNVMITFISKKISGSDSTLNAPINNTTHSIIKKIN